MNRSSSLRYTFYIVVYTPPTAVMVGSLLAELGSIDCAMPVSLAVTRPSYAPTASPLSWSRVVRNTAPYPIDGSSFQLSNTAGVSRGCRSGDEGRLDRLPTQCKSRPRCRILFPIEFYDALHKSRQVGRIRDSVTFLWYHASAASVGKSPTGLRA